MAVAVVAIQKKGRHQWILTTAGWRIVRNGAQGRSLALKAGSASLRRMPMIT
jgi:hypothetical protein